MKGAIVAGIVAMLVFVPAGGQPAAGSSPAPVTLASEPRVDELALDGQRLAWLERRGARSRDDRECLRRFVVLDLRMKVRTALPTKCAARSPANYYDLAFTGKHVFWNQWTAGTDGSTASIRTASLNSPADREVASVSFGYGSEVAIPKSANDGRLVYYGGSEFGECRVEMLIPPARRPRHLFVLDRPPTLLALSANRIAVVFADRRTIQIRATGDGRRISRMTTFHTGACNWSLPADPCYPTRCRKGSRSRIAFFDAVTGALLASVAVPPRTEARLVVTGNTAFFHTSTTIYALDYKTRRVVSIAQADHPHHVSAEGRRVVWAETAPKSGAGRAGQRIRALTLP